MTRRDLRAALTVINLILMREKRLDDLPKKALLHGSGLRWDKPPESTITQVWELLKDLLDEK